ncbi:MAG: ABC transporter permease, partial [Prevotellaceae bacterium]|nr:ABC transporter permease [Prevotellaceae bacterium]
MLKLSLRTLMHYRLYSTINLLGLALSLTCLVIIARYVYSELTVDRFNTKMDRIFVTTQEISNSPGRWGFAGFLYEQNIFNHPGIENYTSFVPAHDDIVVENTSYHAELFMIDSGFLQIFDYTVLTGATNIRRPEDAFLTETFAAKIFGEENPVGKTFLYPAFGKMLTVAGIIRTPPGKSMLSFDILTGKLLEPGSFGSCSLMLLSPNVDYRDINRQYDAPVAKTPAGYEIRYRIFPYKDIYFDKTVSDGIFSRGNLAYVFILSCIGILLLLTGLVNYININAVVMMRRNKELGLKKIFGASGFRIFTQLFFENLLIVAVSLVLAFWIAMSAHPFVENVLGIRQYPAYGFDLWLASVLILALPVAVSLAPYLRYRYSVPVRSLRAVGAGRKSLLSRNFFLAFQYFMTMGLIVVSLFFVKQLYFMLNKDLGFRTKNIISVPFLEFSNALWYTLPKEEYNAALNKLKETGDVLRQKLNASTALESWSFGSFPFKGRGNFEFKTAVSELQSVNLMFVDETWLKMFDIELLAGRLWDNEIDNLRTYNLIVTESVLKQFNIDDWRNAGLQPFRRIWRATNPDEAGTNPPYRIVGVVKDFDAEHLSKQTTPTVFHFNSAHESFPVIASFAPRRRQEVIEFMKNLHDEFVGGEFSYSF